MAYFSLPSFSDGQAVTHTDLNAATRSPLAYFYDQATRPHLHNLVGTGAVDFELGAVPSTVHAYAISGGGGYVVPGPSPRTLALRGGTLLQVAGNVTGSEAALIPYAVVDDEQVFAVAPGAAQPRIDLVALRLQWTDAGVQSRNFEDGITRAKLTQSFPTQRRVNASWQIVQGTPATVPTYPNLSAGFCAIAAVYVPAGYNAVFNAATHLRDLRLPLGIRAVRVDASQFVYDTANTWTLARHASGFNYATATLGVTNTNGLRVLCPEAGQHQRLIGVRLYASLTVFPLVRLTRITYGVSSPIELAVLTPSLSGSTLALRTANEQALRTSTTFAFRGISNAQGVGDPLWCSGYPAGASLELGRNSVASDNALALEMYGTQGNVVYGVQFFTTSW